ncbi:DUF6386 family protein [Pseudochelatococcus sp. B33]
MEKTIMVGTDVAHLLLFHPDDLAHRDNDPIAWYGYDFAYRRESAAGRLIAWGTGSDGGYAVRLTTDSLTAEERAHACASWAFPLLVRHGRILLDNTNALPGASQVVDPDEIVDDWFELANGSYRVTVHPVDRAEPEAADLPDYVVTFEAVESIAGIPVADTPPGLRPFREWIPRQPQSMETDARFLWQAKTPDGDTFAALVVPPEIALLPGLSASLPVSEEVADVAYPRRGDREPGLILATKLEPGALAVLARASGRSWMRGRGTSLALTGLAAARILAVGPGTVLDQARVTVLEKPDMAADRAADESDIAACRAALLAAARRSGLAHARVGPLPVSGFEIERMETLVSAEALTGWALAHLVMPFDARLALWASSARERMAGIGDFLRQEGVTDRS